MRKIDVGETFRGERTTLRLLTLADCTERYVGWLNDPVVSQYLETRYVVQTLAMVESFVGGMVASPDSYLFAIIDVASNQHVGNIKIGPVQARHGFADVSYFIGDRPSWGKGLASDAIRVATRVGFERLELHRLQAGLYETNVGSAKALEKAGYRFEASLRKQLRVPDGWEDHVWYGALREEWVEGALAAKNP
jgi:ribosomal-protein-alanine N-acetyltransferase